MATKAKEVPTEATTGTAMDLVTGGSARGRGIRERVSDLLATVDGLTQGQVATEAEMSPATLSLYLRGQYTGSPANIEKKLGKWLAGREEQEAARARIPAPPTFVKTRTAAELMSSLQYAHALGTMTAVMGVPGIGKSEACKEYQRRYSSVWIASMAAHSPGVVPALKRVCRAVGGVESTGASTLADEIQRKISGTSGLLIIDEAHHLSLPSLDALRALYDDSGVAIALVGDIQLADKLSRMPQVNSRIAPKLYRRQPLKDDVDALLDAWGIEQKRQRTYLHQLVRDRTGALRTLSQVLRLATAIAQGSGEGLSVEQLQRAVAILSTQATQEDDHV